MDRVLILLKPDLLQVICTPPLLRNRCRVPGKYIASRSLVSTTLLGVPYSFAGSPPAPTEVRGKGGDKIEAPYCETDSSLSSDIGLGGAGRGSSKSSFGSSLSGSPVGSDGTAHGNDPMQYSDEDDEGKDGYKVGGYHAVKVIHTPMDLCVLSNECTFFVHSPLLFFFVMKFYR